MGSIDGNNNQINFGSGQVELGKSNGVKKETFSFGDKENTRIMNTIFKKFDKNGDGYLDTEELNSYYQALSNAAKDGKMSKSEAEDLAAQLKLNGVRREHFEKFTQILATENDGVSTEWNGNTCTIKDGNRTLIKEYNSDKHNRLSRKTIINGNTTEVTEFHTQGKTITTTVGTADLLASKKIEEYNSDRILVSRKEISGDGKYILTEFDKDGKTPINVTEGVDDTVVQTIANKPNSTPVVDKGDKKTNIVNNEHSTGEKIDYTRIPEANQTMVFVMLMKYRNDPPEREYLDILAKFPNVNLTETANLLKKYPDSAPMLVDYFMGNDRETVENNFGEFLTRMGINFEKEGYFISSTRYNDKFIPTMVSYTDRVALSQEKTQEKLKEFLFSKNII